MLEVTPASSEFSAFIGTSQTSVLICNVDTSARFLLIPNELHVNAVNYC